MTSERDNSIKIRALLYAGQSPTKNAKHLNVSRATVHNVLGRESIERKPGSGGKVKVNPKSFNTAVEADPLKSIRAHVNDLGMLVAFLSGCMSSPKPGQSAMLISMQLRLSSSTTGPKCPWHTSERHARLPGDTLRPLLRPTTATLIIKESRESGN